MELWSNNAKTKLNLPLAIGGISFEVTPGTGALFPTVAPPDFFYVTLDNGSRQVEIVKVTARVGDTFTCVRAQQGTTARAWLIETKAENRLTKESLEDLQAAEAHAYMASNLQFGKIVLKT